MSPTVQSVVQLTEEEIATRDAYIRDTHLDHLVLRAIRGKKSDNLDVAELITDAELEETMDASSTFTITLTDPDQDLLNSDHLAKRIDINVNGNWYRLYAIKKNDQFLDLVFENREISILRSHKAVQRGARGHGGAHMTRAEFCVFLARKAKAANLKFSVPELHKTQPRKRLKQEDVNRLVSRDPGFGPNPDIKVKNVKASKHQINVLEQILQVGTEMNIRAKLLICAVMVVTQESLAGKINHSPITYVTGPGGQGIKYRYIGPFHQDSFIGSVWRKNGGGTLDVKKSARAFFRAARKVDQDDEHLSYGQLCLTVQNPGGGPEQYQQWKIEATHTVDQFRGGTSSHERTRVKRYTYSTVDDQGNKQNYWDAIKRLMDEVKWACFVNHGRLYLVAEEDLIRSKPRMRLSENSEGIHRINFDYNINKEEASATITCSAERWLAPPGSVVVLEDCGVANGRWLVSSISRSMFSQDTTIELKQREHSLKEPVSEVVDSNIDDSRAPGGAWENVPIGVYYAWKEAQRIDGKSYPYIWGGGHAHAGRADHGTPYHRAIGFDCSGLQGALAWAMGYSFGGSTAGLSTKGPGPYVGKSGDFNLHLRPGPGKYLSFYYNHEHTFSEFTNTPANKQQKKKVIHVGTGRWGTEDGGPGIKPDLHPHAAFSVGHFPGQ